MTIDYLLKGLLIGLSVAAPVGPIGVLCIKRTLTEGKVSGFVTGMGAAVADTLYGCVAGFGLTAISAFLVQQSLWLKLVGGAFLLYLGISFLKSKPADKEATLISKGLMQNFVSTLLLTLTNPTTILSFLAIFAGLGLGSQSSSGDYTSSLVLVAGVFLGSAMWWLILSNVVGLLRHNVTPAHFVWVNRLSGVVIICFGLWAVYSGVYSLI